MVSGQVAQAFSIYVFKICKPLPANRYVNAMVARLQNNTPPGRHQNLGGVYSESLVLSAYAGHLNGALTFI